MEAVKQGTACVGMKNKTHAVVAALKRSPSELSGYQKKIFPIDEHIGMAMSGLTSDARSLCRYMRSECLSQKWSFSEPLPVGRLVSSVASKMQRCTQFWGRRPFGVGVLLAGFDEKGPHIYAIDPSANYADCKAMAIGARSQSARTYLERNLDAFPGSDLPQLVAHALKALRDCLPTDTELTTRNTSVCIVGQDAPFAIYEDDQVAGYLASIAETAAPVPAAAAAAPPAEAPME